MCIHISKTGGGRIHYNAIICKRRDTGLDNKVRELATVCLPWQHWTKTLVRFDDVGMSAFHSCVVVDLWQSLDARMSRV